MYVEVRRGFPWANAVRVEFTRSRDRAPILCTSPSTTDRRKALKHHPDKANDSKAWNPASESYFKCVQKAYEYMSEPAKRRLFDSVDPCFDDDLPDAASIVEATSASGSDGFVSLFAPVFERNAHFSTRQPVPTIGDGSTTAANRTHVEAFYAFWCAFDSWRSFDLRLDIPEDVENRDERRYVEKQVKAERVKLKKEEKVTRRR